MYGESQRIVIYPDRGKLIRYAALYLVVTPLMAITGIGPLRAALPDGSAQPAGAIFDVVLGLVVLAVSILLGALFLLTLYRVLVAKPSVIVTEDGIFDGCSLVAGGLGLLRWHEIEAIIPALYRKGMAFVIVYPRDARVALMRRGALARLFLLILNVTLPGAISLPEWLLPMPAGEVCERIRSAYPRTLQANGIGIPGGLPDAT